MTKRCEWCRFWTPPPKSFEAWETPTEYGLCQLASSRDGVPTLGRGAQAFALDGEAYMADFYTMPTFGCERFMPQEDA